MGACEDAFTTGIYIIGLWFLFRRFQDWTFSWANSALTLRRRCRCHIASIKVLKKRQLVMDF